jgi:putative membrane protein
MYFLLRVFLMMASLGIVSIILPGIHFSGLLALFLAALVVGLANAVIRPILILFTLPLVLLSFGLFIFMINAFLLWLASVIVPGFHLNGFGTALLGALLISVVSFILNRMVAGKGRVRSNRRFQE